MGDALTGLLADGRRAEVVDGIARFTGSDDPDQLQTERSFAYKWSRRDSYESPAMRERAQRWLLDRYGFGDAEEMRRFFAARGDVLDAGCGSGFSASLWLAPGWSGGTASWTGADISAAVDVARERLAGIERLSFVQADILDLPFREETFGAILAEGVLHHTPSTERALKALVPLLQPQGELMFYVYRRKAPVREFTDDYVRDLVSALAPEEAWEALKPLTALGRALAELNAEVSVPDVPLLGIQAGRYDVQRLIYWNFAKLFWDEDLSFDENVHVNFDWYHPRYAHRQTEEQVRRWCTEAMLEIERFHLDPAGFTVRARRR